MMRLSPASAVVLFIAISSQAADMPLMDSMLYADSLRAVLGLPATHVEFDTDGALVAISGQGDFNDSMAQSLTVFPRLRELRIDAPHLTTAGFQAIGKRMSLEVLSVLCSGIANEDIRMLAALPKLSYLEISNTPAGESYGRSLLTDEAVPHLAKCKSLKTLVLSNTGISARGVERLKELLPNTNIDIDQ